VDDRDRTIRLQRDLIEQLEAEKRQKIANGSGGDPGKELISMATQTERVSWAFWGHVYIVYTYLADHMCLHNID